MCTFVFFSIITKKIEENNRILLEFIKFQQEQSQINQANIQSFDKYKEILQSILLLTHYDPSIENIVAADA